MKTYVLPRTPVLWLFLHPDDFLEVRVAPDRGAEIAHRRRVEELDATDRDVRPFGAMLRSHEVDIDFAAAEDHPADLPRPPLGLLVWNHELEMALSQLAGGRRHCRVAQQALGRQHHERERIDDEQRGLPPQQMETLSRRRAVRDPGVGVSGALEE